MCTYMYIYNIYIYILYIFYIYLTRAYEIDICLVTVMFYVFSGCKCLTQKKKKVMIYSIKSL